MRNVLILRATVKSLDLDAGTAVLTCHDGKDLEVTTDDYWVEDKIKIGDKIEYYFNTCSVYSVNGRKVEEREDLQHFAKPFTFNSDCDLKTE